MKVRFKHFLRTCLKDKSNWFLDKSLRKWKFTLICNPILLSLFLDVLLFLFFSWFRIIFELWFRLLLSLDFLHIILLYIPLYYSVFWVVVGFYGWKNPNYLRFKENHTWEYGTTYYASSDVVYFRPKLLLFFSGCI